MEKVEYFFEKLKEARPDENERYLYELAFLYQKVDRLEAQAKHIADKLGVKLNLDKI